MSIRGTFYNSYSVINEYDKDAVMEISTMLGPVYHVACGKVLLNRTFYTFI